MKRGGRRATGIVRCRSGILAALFRLPITRPMQKELRFPRIEQGVPLIALDSGP